MGDYYNIINTAAEDAEKRGRDAGLAEGRSEAQAEIAKKMLESGVSVEQIAQFTGLTPDEVAALQE